MPKFFSPRTAKTTTEPPMKISEMTSAIQRLPRKSKVRFGTRSSIVILLRLNLSTIQRNPVRVKSSAENIEAMMPSVSVTANPFTEPVACQKRMSAVMRVVAFASKMALNALS